MKLMRILFLLCAISIPATSMHPYGSRHIRRPAAVYYHYQNCQCNVCYPYYEYYCPYCYDCFDGCSECDRTVGKIFLIGILIATTAYLLDQALKS